MQGSGCQAIHVGVRAWVLGDYQSTSLPKQLSFEILVDQTDLDAKL